jgi:thymidine phosphorylase
VLDSGAALERWLAMVEAQGGERSRVEREGGLATAPVVREARAGRSGAVARIDTFALGERVVEMGGGRRAKEDAVDPRVGLRVRARLGDAVQAGAPLAEVHLAQDDPGMVERVAACFVIGEGAPVPPLILDRLE